MEQPRADALDDAKLARLSAELEVCKCRAAALEAQLAQTRAEGKLLSLQSESKLAPGVQSKAHAPPLAGRFGPGAAADDDDDGDVAAMVSEGDDGGVAVRGSGNRCIVAPSGCGVQPARRERDVLALLDAGINAPAKRDDDTPTPHAARAVSGAGRSTLPAVRPRTEAAAGAVGFAASVAAEEALRTAQGEQRFQALTAAKEAAMAALGGFLVGRKPGDELGECAKILRGCLMKSWGVVFAMPVDPIADNLPDYTDIVQRPMDFTTITSKLIGNEYEDGFGFKSDMELVFANCKLYNQKGDTAFIAAEMGWQIFTTHAKRFLPQYYAPPAPPKQARARARKRARADATERGEENADGGAGAAGGEEGVVRAAKRSVERAAETAAAARARFSAAVAARTLAARTLAAQKARGAAVSSPKKRQKTVEEETRPPITSQHKRALTFAMANLPIVRQARLLQIITGVLETTDDEVEIDLDMMDNATLWRLMDYCFPGAVRAEIEAAAAETLKNERAAAAAQAAAAAAQAAAAAARTAPAAAPKSSSSSSSSSDSSSSDSDSDSDEDSPDAAAKLAKPAPPAPHALQNADAWARFAAGEATGEAMTEAAAGETQAAMVTPEMWSAFAAKEAAKQAALKARADEAAAEAARLERERVAAAEAATAAAAATAEREAARARAAAELDAVPMHVDLEAQAAIMREMEMETQHQAQQRAVHVPADADGLRRVPDTSRPKGAGGGSWFNIV